MSSLKSKFQDWMTAKLLGRYPGNQGLPLPVYTGVRRIISGWNVELVLFSRNEDGILTAATFDLGKHPFYPEYEGFLHLPGKYPGNYQEDIRTIISGIIRKYRLPENLSPEDFRLADTLFNPDAKPGPALHIIEYYILSNKQRAAMPGSTRWIKMNTQGNKKTQIEFSHNMFPNHEAIISKAYNAAMRDGNLRPIS